MTRPGPPPLDLTPDERTALTQFVDFFRASLVDRCYGLTMEQLRETPLPSSLSLARLVGHMAWVERIWFVERFAGKPMSDLYQGIDWETDPDGEMTLAETWGRDELFRVFDEAVAESRRIAHAAELDDLTVDVNPQGEHRNLRWILIHMIEEYARHVGHADLIREAIDGDTAS